MDTYLKAVTAVGEDNDPERLRFASRSETESISALASFTLMLDKLTMKAKNDRVDSIRIEAQSTLRQIVKRLEKRPGELQGIIEGLSRQQIAQLKRYVDIDDLIAAQQK